MERRIHSGAQSAFLGLGGLFAAVGSAAMFLGGITGGGVPFRRDVRLWIHVL